MNERSASTSAPFVPAVPPTRKTSLSLTFIAAATLMLGLSGAWTYLAREQLAASISEDNQTHLQRVPEALAVLRTRTRDALRAQCRVLAEDPRLKTTLAIEGIDEATVSDILRDLRQLQRSGFLMVVTPDGRVFAQAGADELRGLDLSGSSVIQAAKASSESVVGSWVIARQLMDLGAMPVRSDNIVIAYLVVGQAIDKDTITALATSTGVATAIGLGNEIVVASTDEPDIRALFTSIANDVRRTKAQVTGAAGRTYVTAFIELDEAQPRPYLVLASSLEASASRFKRVEWLHWLPPLLVALALLLARIRSKQLPRMSRTGGV